ncbi:MAG: DUF4203 domain-containing protein [Acidobacteriota bacterium]
MLPLSLQVPASLVFLAGGAVACFAGYRLFRFVLGMYGFFLGALVASSMVGTEAGWSVVLAALAGGALGALVLVAASFVAVALLGAGLGAFLANLLWKPLGNEPHVAAVIIAAALGGFAAMAVQRHVIVAGTALGGAWTMLVGAAALMLGKGVKAGSAAGDLWVVYPNTTGPDRMWVYLAWVAIALAGIFIQLRTGGGKAKGKKPS